MITYCDWSFAICAFSFVFELTENTIRSLIITFLQKFSYCNFEQSDTINVLVYVTVLIMRVVIYNSIGL